MAWLQKYPSGTFHLNFRFGGQKFKRSLKTKSESESNCRLQRLEENIRLVESGRLEIPADADVTVFLLSDGRLHEKPQVNRSLTLTELFTRYLAALPDGTLEETTLAGIRIHQRHLERRIGRRFAVQSLRRETLQTYVNRRAKEPGIRGRNVSPTTIRKELSTLRTVWNWARDEDLVNSEFPNKGLKYPKLEEKPRFQTWDEITARCEQPQLSEAESADLWDCLFLQSHEVDELLEYVRLSAAHSFIYSGGDKPMISLLLTVLLGVMANANASPTSYRVVVLDCSSSMSGQELKDNARASRRIDIAIAEIRDVAKQLPPSPANPIGIVHFNSWARGAEFTDPQDLEAYLEQISPSGGTAISAGLAKGHEFLKNGANASVMFLLLYTDGENGEPDGARKVAEQEAALDRLFAERHDHGLATHVICRRWANANDDWIKKLKSKPKWSVLDAADFSLKTVTAAPVIEVEDVRWIDHDHLEVSLRGHAQLRGTNELTDAFSISCKNGLIDGNSHIELPSDQRSPKRFSVVTKLTPIAKNAGQGELAFQLDSPPPQILRGQALLPTADPRVFVRYKIPHRDRALSLAAEMRATSTRWRNPSQRQVITDIELTLSIGALDNLNQQWPTPIDFLIEAAEECVIVAGSPIIRATKEGASTHKLSLACKLAEGAAEGKMGVRIIPQNLPSYFTIRPNETSCRAPFPHPGPSRTMVTATAGPPVNGKWFDLANEIAVFEFPVQVNVQGPTTNASFTVVAPPTVHDVKFSPSQLSSGEQTIQVQMLARCIANQTSNVQLQVVPPAATDALLYEVEKTISVRIVGPAPLKLVLARGEQLADGLRIEIPDAMDAYENTLSTAILGPYAAAKTQSVRAELTMSANLPFKITDRVRIGEQQLRDDAASGKLPVDKLIDVVALQQHQIREMQKRIDELEAIIKSNNPTKRLDEPYSEKAESKRNPKPGKRKRKPLRRGRISTAEKIKLAERTESVFPEAISRDDCKLSHTRVAGDWKTGELSW